VDITGSDCGGRVTLVVISAAGGGAAGSAWATRFPGASAAGAMGPGLVLLARPAAAPGATAKHRLVFQPHEQRPTRQTRHSSAARSL
jgi:hypothetical protein